MQIALAKKGACLFHLKFSLCGFSQVCGFSFVPFSWAFPFLCLLVTAILDLFSYSNYLTFPPQEIGGPVLWEEAH